MKACDAIAEILHDQRRDWIAKLLLETQDQSTLASLQTLLRRLRMTYETPFEDLSDEEKDRVREQAIEVQKVYIGEGDDDEFPEHQKGRHGKA